MSELDLKGNAHPDVAGSLLTFTDPAPGPGDETTNLRILPVGYPSGVGLKLTP